MSIRRVISGGQTGVDRAALDVALDLGIDAGGWCPAGRRAEDGSIPGRYPLRETPAPDYEQRTEWNVWEADGTLILTMGSPGGGTAYTIEIAEAVGRPCRVVDLTGLTSEHEFSETAEGVRQWLEEEGVGVLNVAGPRASKNSTIEEVATRFLRQLL
jgi:hypothetical protein